MPLVSNDDDTHGWELPIDYLGEILPDGMRKNVGIKYYRVTGKVGLGDKQPYVRSWAMQKAASHAGNFLENRQRQVRAHAAKMSQPPLVVSPYDAELFDGDRSVLVARVNGELRDLAHVLADGDAVEPVTAGEQDGLDVLRHSAAHVLAQAVQEVHPDARLGIGPPVPAQKSMHKDSRRECEAQSDRSGPEGGARKKSPSSVQRHQIGKRISRPSHFRQLKREIQ